jgi:hypothetical protein
MSWIRKYKVQEVGSTELRGSLIRTAKWNAINAGGKAAQVGHDCPTYVWIVCSCYVSSFAGPREARVTAGSQKLTCMNIPAASVSVQMQQHNRY